MADAAKIVEPRTIADLTLTVTPSVTAGQTILHGTAALSFGLTASFAYRWLRERW